MTSPKHARRAPTLSGSRFRDRDEFSLQLVVGNEHDGARRHREDRVECQLCWDGLGSLASALVGLAAESRSRTRSGTRARIDGRVRTIVAGVGGGRIQLHKLHGDACRSRYDGNLTQHVELTIVTQATATNGVEADAHGVHRNIELVTGGGPFTDEPTTHVFGELGQGFVGYALTDLDARRSRAPCDTHHGIIPWKRRQSATRGGDDRREGGGGGEQCERFHDSIRTIGSHAVSTSSVASALGASSFARSDANDVIAARVPAASCASA